MCNVCCFVDVILCVVMFNIAGKAASRYSSILLHYAVFSICRMFFPVQMFLSVSRMFTFPVSLVVIIIVIIIIIIIITEYTQITRAGVS